MAIAIANVELTDSFDKWRITTNQALKALREEVVTKEEVFLETVLDSVEVAATPIGPIPVGGNYVVSDTVQLTDVNKIVNFKAGQKVRVYGAKFNTGVYDVLTAPPQPYNVAKTNLDPADPADGHQFSYFVRQYDYNVGKISNASAIINVTNVDLEKFNDINNISFRLTRNSVNLGLLVYRKITGPTINTNYNLIYVMGPRDIVGTTDILFEDFYDYDNVIWSKKNGRNEFDELSGLIHFPISSVVPPTAANNVKLGWIDTEVKFVDTTQKRLSFISTCEFESSCIVSHDDTELLQAAINDRNTQGYKSIVLPTKIYIVKGIVVPNNFSIIGTGSKTTLRKLSWSSSYETTGNRILISTSSVNDFSLTNLNIDGNMQNQYLNSESTDPGANYIIDVQGSVFRYENIKITNTIGGGINAADSSSISVISSFIVDSNLNDRDSFSPLNISSSSDVVLTSNIFRNYSGPVEASTLSTGSIIGNIVKNCGSGLVIYGSTNLISSPNILMGPAGEFLPSADILNSEYDSVNIKLERDMGFTSTIYNYQENGDAINLSPTGPNRTTVYHRVDRLQKIQTEETLYGDEILIAGNKPLQPASGANSIMGQFRFSISNNNVNILLNQYSFTNLIQQNPNHIGIVYRSIAQEYAPSANVATGVTPIINAISRSISANTVGVNSTTNTIKLNNIANTNPFDTWFKTGDEVYYNLPSTNTAIGGLTANTVYYVSFANNTDVALTTTYNGANIDLTETRTTAVAEAHALNKRLYQVSLLNAVNVFNGSRVKFDGHQGDPNFDQRVGTVLSYNETTQVCVIAYDPTINIVTPGSGGVLGVENSYVLAKGRIL